ncbi:hypothetical protein BS78_06G050000 [Paspalum vaginatum]|nr:hypothetical protein BS78_06G050000 [Paspalum vaginatum]
MEEWLSIQNFFHGLHQTAQEHLDAAAEGSFLSLSVAAARTLIEKMASNQGWRQERVNNKPRGVHHIDSTDMLAAKMDLLLKKLEDIREAVPVQALDSQMTCEHCGNTSHMGNSCPGNGSEDINFINNNSFNNSPCPQPGWNLRPHLPFSGQGTSSGYQQFNKNPFDEKAVNDSISKKFLPNNRILENMSLQMETLNSAMKNQLSFNKMLETQIAQLAAALPSPTSGKLLGQPEAPPKEHINAVTTRGGRSTQDPPHPRNAGREQEKPAEPEKEDQVAEPQPVKEPTYAKCLKDILNNKKPLPSTKVVHLTEECSAAILNQPPQKKKDPGNPTISCSIGTHHFDQALCDLGASVSVMPKVVFDKITHATLAPTAMCLQLANQSIRYLDGIAEDIPVKIRNFIVPLDFVVLDMEIDSKTPLILG